MPKPDHRIQLVVVVSGVAQQAEINVHEPLQNLVRSVLHASGDLGRSVDEYELRTEDGRLLELGDKVGAAGLSDGETLFLNPRAGAGG